MKLVFGICWLFCTMVQPLAAQGFGDWGHVLSRGGRVVDLSGRGLTMLPAFGLDASVQVLILDDNEFSEIPLDLADRCPNLRALSMNHNHVFEISELLIRLPFLEELYLDENEINTVSPALGSCQSLRLLSLSHNQLISLNFHIEDLRLLEVLWVDNNRISQLPADIGDCRFLRDISARNNQIDYVTDRLGNCELLEVLNLAGNSRLNRLPADLEYCDYLRYIDVGGTGIGEVPDWANRMEQLEFFVLEGE